MFSRLEIAAIIAGIVALAGVGAWLYIDALQSRIESLESQVVAKPIEAKAEAYHQTAIERIKEIEEEYRETNESVGDSNHSSGVADLDWMFR